MNVKLKKIFVIVISCLVFITTSVLTGTTVYYKHQYKQSVERYRQLVDESRKRNEQYEATFRAARATNNDIGECLSRCEYSLSELRDALYIIRERYTEMENLLNSVRSDDCNTDSSGDCSASSDG